MWSFVSHLKLYTCHCSILSAIFSLSSSFNIMANVDGLIYDYVAEKHSDEFLGNALVRERNPQTENPGSSSRWETIQLSTMNIATCMHKLCCSMWKCSWQIMTTVIVTGWKPGFTGNIDRFIRVITRGIHLPDTRRVHVRTRSCPALHTDAVGISSHTGHSTGCEYYIVRYVSDWVNQCHWGIWWSAWS